MSEQNSSSPRLTLAKALSVILLSVIVCTGIPAMVVFYFKHLHEKQRNDPGNDIVALLQSTPDGERLKSVYLAELLNLSIDNPTNLYRFKSKEAEQRLIQLPMIRQVQVKKIKPGIVHIDYILRRPIAFIGDFKNAAIDEQGYIFPFKPFYTPKKLPEIFLGTNLENSEVSADWGMKLDDTRQQLAFLLLNLASEYCCDDSTYLTRIDVSKAFSSSYGQRQIVMIFEEKHEKIINKELKTVHATRILRLSPDNYHQQLANYLELSKYLREKEKKEKITNQKTIIDLRLSNLAFIERLP